MSSVNISNIQSTGNQAQDMQNLFDAYARLRKELIHGLSFLDDENVPMLKTIVGDIEGAFTAIEQTENAITLLAADVSGNTSAITVLSNEISLKVNANGIIAAINLSSEGVDIQGSKINLVGAVTVLSDITGNLGTITAGTINGIQINSANIAISENISIGERVTLSATTVGSGIYWGTSGTNIKYDPAGGSLTMFGNQNVIIRASAGNGNIYVEGNLNLSGSHNIVAKFA